MFVDTAMIKAFRFDIDSDSTRALIARNKLEWDIYSDKPLNDDMILDRAAECSENPNDFPLADANGKPVTKLVSAVQQWLQPFVRRRGWISLRRVRLQCGCQLDPNKGIHEPCSQILPFAQRHFVGVNMAGVD